MKVSVTIEAEEKDIKRFLKSANKIFDKATKDPAIMQALFKAFDMDIKIYDRPKAKPKKPKRPTTN